MFKYSFHITNYNDLRITLVDWKENFTFNNILS